MKKQLFILSLLLGTIGMQAQEVSTLYFLENAPMRHQINPAFQPVSNGYINFTPLGYTSIWEGNNSLTLSDAFYKSGSQTISALHPNGDKQKLMNQFRKVTLGDMSITMDLLSFGFRYKEKGYVHIGMRERAFAGLSVPKGLYNFTLNGGMSNPTGDNTIDLSKLNLQLGIYTEISGGYSHQINEKWTVGGKLKLLFGQIYFNQSNPDLGIEANTQQWYLHGKGTLQLAAPIDMSVLPTHLNSKTWTNGVELSDQSLLDYIKPTGYGAAFDLGFTYKPHPQVQISAAINDLGLIYWNRAVKYNTTMDTVFNGVGDFEYKDYVVNNVFQSDSLMNDVMTSLSNITNNIRGVQTGNGFAKMLNAQLNIGVDANFCNNILGIGIVSKTRMFGSQIYEEVTLGGAVRPCNWFNLAVSYSLVNNGKYSNIGAGLSFMPYDGINMTLAMDYIPTSYAAYNGSYYLPYKTKGVNLALGFSIVWGTNKRKKPHQDEVSDQIVMSPDTIQPAIVDSVNYTQDEDGDGVPDYRDSCFTLPEAVAFVDSLGCDKDTDLDGVPDYLDECPHAAGPKENNGCPIIKKEIRSLLKKAMQGIQFETGKAIIRKSSYATLDKIAKVFIENTNYIIEVQGHSDNTGSDERNLELSQQRADAVMEYLVKAGVPQERMTAVGYGPQHPIADNATAYGRALNRRVEFIINAEQVRYETILDHAK